MKVNDIRKMMEQARDELLVEVARDPNKGDWVLERQEAADSQFYTKRRGNEFSFLHRTIVTSEPEAILKTSSDINFLTLWDQMLQTASEDVIEEGLVTRRLIYMGGYVSPDPIEVRVACMFGLLPDLSSFYTVRTIAEEDQIFPDTVELSMSGVYAKKLADGRTEAVQVSVLRLNTPELAEEAVRGLKRDMQSRFQSLIQASSIQASNNQPSFEFPNRGSMGDAFGGRSFLQSIDFGQGSLPKLPSFSTLSLPMVSPRTSFVKAPKEIDVILPKGVKAREYWAGAFENYGPLIVFNADLDKVEYSNLSFQILLGTQTDFVGTDPATIISPSDVSVLKTQANAVIAQRIAFFVHLVTFESDGALMVAEANCSGCFLAEGWFFVMELRPLFTKKKGVLTSKNPFPEAFKFNTFFGANPTPTVIVTFSGVIVQANPAMCSFANVDLLNTALVGEHICSALKQYGGSNDDLRSALERLSSKWFQLEQRSQVLENNFGTVVGLTFLRGTNLVNDTLKCFLISFHGNEAYEQQKRRKMSISK